MFVTRERIITLRTSADCFYCLTNASEAESVAAACNVGFVDEVEAYRTLVFAILLLDGVCDDGTLGFRSSNRARPTLAA